MEKFNPSDEEIALIEQFILKVILANVKYKLDINMVIGKQGVNLYVNSKLFKSYL